MTGSTRHNQQYQKSRCGSLRGSANYILRVG